MNRYLAAGRDVTAKEFVRRQLVDFFFLLMFYFILTDFDSGDYCAASEAYCTFVSMCNCY